MAQTPDKLEACDVVRPQLALYAAEQLDANETQRVKEHVASCISCAQEAAFAKVLSVSAPRLPLATPPADLFDKIALATYAAPPRRTLRETLLGWVAPAPTRLALGTAFAVGIAALVVLPHLSEKGELTVPPAPSRPVASHPQQKTTEATPAQPNPTVPPATLPVQPNRSEKAVVKNGVTTAGPTGKSRASAADAVAPVPTITEPLATETHVATTTATKSVPQTTMPKTTVKPITIAARKNTPSMGSVHAAQPSETVGHPKTIVAANPAPSIMEEGSDEADDNGAVPDMDRMTKVTMIDKMDMRAPLPTPTSGAADEASGRKSASPITLLGSQTGGRASAWSISSKKASESNIATPNVSIVAAPAKLD